jgi:CRP-like cAMP-binding protein
MFLDIFESEDRARFVEAGELIRLEPGDVLLRCGESGDAIYYVEDGVLEALNAAGRRLSEANAGDVIGEVSFLDGSPRSADVRAVSRSVVRGWTRPRLAALFAGHPELHDPFYQGLVRVQSARLRWLTDTIALVDSTACIRLESGLFVPEHSAIERDGQFVHLTRIERELLVYLAARHGAVVPYRALLTDVWRYHQGVESRTVYATVHRLRTKVEIDPTNPRHILSVGGIGYRFVR